MAQEQKKKPSEDDDFFSQFEEVSDDDFFKEFEAAPVDEEVIIEEPEPMAPPPVVEEVPQTGAERAWSAISDPLVRVPQSVRTGLQKFAEPGLEDTPASAGWKGFISGAGEGLANVVEGFTSPINLAAMALTGGASAAARAGMGATARGLNIAAKAPDALSAVHGAREITRSDTSLAEKAMGAAELFGGAAGLKYNAGKMAPKAVDMPSLTPDALKQAEQILQRNGYSAQTLGLSPEDAVAFAEKLSTEAPLPAPKTTVNIPKATTLPVELSGAKPRYNIGSKSYEPVFDNDVDKALFIISQGKPSRRDADYLKFVMETTGLDEGKARQAGQTLRGQMKGHIAGQEVGAVKMPKLYNEAPKPARPKIKMIGNEPDMNDPVTAEFVRKSQSKQPTPQAERIPPSEEVEIPEIETELPGGNMGDVLKEEPSNMQKFLGLPRALQSTYDLSYPFRQGIGLIHTKGWWSSWGKMLKSFGSEASYQGLMDSISERPNFKPKVVLKDGIPVKGKSFAQEAGLAVTDLKGMREEELSSAWAEKLPGVRASSRAYNAFANKLRADNFDALISKAKEMGLDPEHNLPLAKEIASFINNASGRGDLGSLSKAADTLNNVFFSPRLMASRVQMMNPANYMFRNKMVRKEYLKSMLATAGAWTTMAGLAKLGGADVNMDPTNSDFGKIKIGDTRLDPGAGFQQYLVLATRLARGEFTSSTSGKTTQYGSAYGTPTRMDALVDFAQNKLAPLPSYGARMMNANSKLPFYVGDETSKLFTPIIVQDIIELMQENPDALGIAVPANMLGVSSNTYSSKPQTRMFPESWEMQIPAKRRR